jgi:hypothetical protein
VVLDLAAVEIKLNGMGELCGTILLRNLVCRSSKTIKTLA